MDSGFGVYDWCEVWGFRGGGAGPKTGEKADWGHAKRAVQLPSSVHVLQPGLEKQYEKETKYEKQHERQ